MYELEVFTDEDDTLYSHLYSDTADYWVELYYSAGKWVVSTYFSCSTMPEDKREKIHNTEFEIYANALAVWAVRSNDLYNKV